MKAISRAGGKKMKNALGAALVILTTGCASHLTPVNRDYVISDGQTDTDLQVRVRQMNDLKPMPPMPMSIPGSANSGNTEATAIDIRYAIAIKNQSLEPVTLRHITLFLGESRYLSSPRTTRNYDKAIAPGATETLDFWIEAREPGAQMVPFTPPNVLATIDVEGTPGKRTATFLCGVNGHPGVRTAPR